MKKNNHGPLILGLVAAGLLIVATCGVGVVLMVRAVMLAPRAAPVAFGKQPAAHAPYEHPGPGSESIEKLLADFGGCLRTKGKGADKYWDVRRFAQEVDRRGVLTREGFPPEHPAQVTNMREFLEENGIGMVEDRAYDESEVLSTKWLVDGREAVIEVRHRIQRADKETQFRERWWVVRDGGWRFFDRQQAYAGQRVSTVCAADLEEMEANGGEWTPAQKAATAKFKAAIASTKDGDLAKVERLLADKVLDRLPLTERPIRTRWRASIAMRQRKFAEARTLLAQGEREDPDSPNVYELQAECFYELQEYDRAISAAEQYVRLAGPDEDVCLYHGHARISLGKKAEAAEPYRLALGENPDSVTALVGLNNSLGSDGRAEVEERYRKFRNPAAALDRLIAESDKDCESIAMYMQVVREKTPDAPDVLYQAARLRLVAHDAAGAVALAQRAEKAGGKDVSYLERLAWEAVRHGAETAVYRALPDADAERGFRALAGSLEDDTELEDRADTRRLEALLNAHRTRRPKDVWLAYYEGVLHNERKEYDRAEARFADAMTRAADDEDKDTFRWRRVDNLADAGQIGEAYARIGPVRERFGQLAHRIFDPKDWRVLGLLVWMHQIADPDDPSLPLWRGTVAFRAERYEYAVTEFRAYLAAQGGNSDWWATDHLVRALIRLKRLDEARAALKPAEGREFRNHLLDVAVTAASGDVAATERAVEALMEHQPWSRYSLHNDPDLAPILKTEPFKRLLEKYPLPKTDVPPKRTSL